MKYLIILAVAALAFAGCSAGAEIDPDDAMLPQDSTVAATAVEDVAE